MPLCIVDSTYWTAFQQHRDFYTALKRSNQLICNRPTAKGKARYLNFGTGARDLALNQIKGIIWSDSNDKLGGFRQPLPGVESL